MKVWLLHWDWRGNSSKEPEDPIVGILNGRFGKERVKKYVDYLFALYSFNFSELKNHVKNQRVGDTKLVNETDGIIQAGFGNPIIIAEKVELLSVTLTEDNKYEIIKYKTLPKSCLEVINNVPVLRKTGNCLEKEIKRPYRTFIDYKRKA